MTLIAYHGRQADKDAILVIDQIKGESPGFVEALEKIASSPQFATPK